MANHDYEPDLYDEAVDDTMTGAIVPHPDLHMDHLMPHPQGNTLRPTLTVARRLFFYDADTETWRPEVI